MFATRRHISGIFPLRFRSSRKMVGDGVQQPAITIIFTNYRLLVENSLQRIRITKLWLFPKLFYNPRGGFRNNIYIALTADSEYPHIPFGPFKKAAHNIAAMRR